MTPIDILRNVYGYTNFRNNQAEIIGEIISGKEVLAILPTGGGKSLCYQIPALLSESFAIVISPLIALMQDQVDSINRIKNVAAFINSSLSFFEADSILNEIEGGRIKLLYIAPEKLENNNFVEKIKRLNPEYIFVDEAHCISEWGHNFRPSYKKIKDFCEFLNVEKVSAFTATATPEVRSDIVTQLNLKNPKIFISGFLRENLHLKVEFSESKMERVKYYINKVGTPAIIYTSTRKAAEELNDFLNKEGIKSQYYHAGLNNNTRRIIQDDFVNGRNNIIVSTNAFGMGIDKSDIRLIIHYNLPGSIESYYQEIGRAGRDGEPSAAILLFDFRDKYIQEFFIETSFPSVDQVKTVYNQICNYGKVALGNAYSEPILLDDQLLSNLSKLKINNSILQTCLKILESNNYIKVIEKNFNSFSIKVLMDPQSLKNYTKQVKNQKFKAIILGLIRIYGLNIIQKKHSLNIEKLIEFSGLSYSDIVNNCEKMKNLGIMEFERPLNNSFVRLQGTRVESSSLFLDMKEIVKRKKIAEEKLQLMQKFCYTGNCRFEFILNYFGSENEKHSCGKCDNCINDFDNQFINTNYISEIIMDLVTNSNNSYKISEMVKILRGEEDNKYAHIKYFGSLTNFDSQTILSSINKLVAEGKVEINADRISLITYKESSNDKLLEELLVLRKSVAAKFNQKEEVVCPENVLNEIAKAKPLNPDDAIVIKGVNTRILNKFGDELFEIISSFVQEEKLEEKKENENLPENIKETFKMVKSGYLLEDIALKLKQNVSVIALQIETLIGFDNNLDIKRLFKKDELEKIIKILEKGINDISKVYEELNEEVSYAKIRIALAKFRQGNLS